MKQPGAGLSVTIVLVVAAVAAQLSLQGPRPLPEEAPAEQFSARRARSHLEMIAGQPHPIGSEALERVRGYLVAELRSLGFSPELQTTTVWIPRHHRWRQPVAANVVNVMVRLPGTEAGRAVLVVSHYDSAPQGPGAADDSAAVAAHLEVLRALRQGPPLRNDVIFLFTDAEEDGLLGARGFMEHPWVEDVAVVLNFEARGTGGPLLMFETSPGNGRLIRELRAAGIDPVTYSYGYEIYKILPNITDFSIFRRHQLRGMNFAFIHGGTAYHTAQDSLAKLDSRTVQHVGESTLGLARHFGDIDLEGDWETADAVYFTLPGSIFLSYPGSWVWPLTGLLTLGVLALLIAGWRRRWLSVGGLLLAVLANLVGAALVGGLLYLARALAFGPRYNFFLGRGWTSNALILLGLMLVAAALTVAFARLVAGKLSVNDRVGAGLLIWCLLTFVVTFGAAGASYLFALPLILSLAAAAWGWIKAPGTEIPPGLLLLLALGAGLSALLWTPTLSLIGVALGPGASMPAGICVFLLLFGLLAPQLSLIAAGRRGWIGPAAAVALAVILIITVRLASGFDADNRRMNSILYTLDAESGEGFWISYDRAPDEWTEQFLTARPDRGPKPDYLGGRSMRLRKTAPAAPFPRPEVELLADLPGPGTQVIELRIGWPYQVHRALLHLHFGSELLRLEVAGREVDLPALTRHDPVQRLDFNYLAPPPEGIRLGIERAVSEEPLHLELVAQRYELPQLPDFSYQPRPPHLMSLPDWFLDSTFVRHQVVVPAGIGSADRDPTGSEGSPDAGGHEQTSGASVRH